MANIEVKLVKVYKNGSVRISVKRKPKPKKPKPKTKKCPCKRRKPKRLMIAQYQKFQMARRI